MARPSILSSAENCKSLKSVEAGRTSCRKSQKKRIYSKKPVDLKGKNVLTDQNGHV
jgi:hypothetical protein